MKKITAGLLLALSANAISFEELNKMSATTTQTHSLAFNKCSQAYTTAVGTRLSGICQKNKWAADRHVLVFNPDTEESCYLTCGTKFNPTEVGTESDLTGKPMFSESARSFVSEEDADRMTRMGKFRAMNDENPKEWIDALFPLYKKAFPEVTFHFDEQDNTVNAYAWKDLFGRRHLKILGGLVRHESVKKEGLAIVIAHELGHHFGGKPTGGLFGRGLSCDGQADFIGVRDIMRTVWPGEEYLDLAHKGTTQMAGFFNTPDSPKIPDGTVGCVHPPANCRIATYYLALSLLHDKPKCAGPTK